MDKGDSNLAHAIKLKYGTAPEEPTDLQLAKIKEAVLASGKGASASSTLWDDAVKKNCPTAGKYKYSGVDNSDLNALLSMALKPKGN